MDFDYLKQIGKMAEVIEAREALTYGQTLMTEAASVLNYRTIVFFTCEGHKVEGELRKAFHGDLGVTALTPTALTETVTQMLNALVNTCGAVAHLAPARDGLLALRDQAIKQWNHQYINFPDATILQRVDIPHPESEGEPN